MNLFLRRFLFKFENSFSTMCGITGFIHYNKNLNQDDLRKMVNTIDYRGPDDEGFYINNFRDYQVGMGFRRLAIIDLSMGGHQPMIYKNLVITLNGEIYNYREIREELHNHGFNFESGSDTEVVIKSFYYWGINMVERFIGMFAIAIYNIETNELYLIRDRMGIKPLYYSVQGKDLIYGSELKPIITYPGFSKVLNFDSLSKYLYHGYINSPDSIFLNVFKLEPGSYLKWSVGNLIVKKYWNLTEIYSKNKLKEITNENECLQQLDDLLTSSIRYRMISDVSIGSFLSGGIDSSLTTAIMQKLSGQPVNTFSIGFEDEKYNEADHARAVSNHLGTHHYELVLPVGKAIEIINELPLYYDEPFGDSSALPTILVSRLAKKNATVVLSGDGGDELFCGYNNYVSAKKMSRLIPLGRLMKMFPEQADIGRRLFKINPRFGRYQYLDKNINIVNIDYILSKYFLAGIFSKNQYNLDNKYFELSDLTTGIQELYMLNDMVNYLPNDILTKVDRASMSVSLEARVPILDHRIVEFSFRVPHHLKYNNGIQKYLLKKLAYNYIPKTLLERPKKGFSVPVFKWMKSDLRFLLDTYLSDDYIIKQQVFNNQAVKNLLSMFNSSQNSSSLGNYVWNILMFQLWYEKYMK
jgi:asparagine synthase (glutamine-hydrolysing)